MLTQSSHHPLSLSLSLASVSPAPSFRDAYFARSLIPLLRPLNYASPCWHSSCWKARLWDTFPKHSSIIKREIQFYRREKAESSRATQICDFFIFANNVSRCARDLRIRRAKVLLGKHISPFYSGLPSLIVKRTYIAGEADERGPPSPSPSPISFFPPFIVHISNA